MKLLLVSEGPLDIGTGRGAADAKGTGDERRGAVGVLVRRLLEEKLGRDLHEWEIESDVLPRVHARSEDVSGYERKVCLAIREAGIRGCSSVAIVVDRDRTEGGARLAALRAGRSMAERQGQPLALKTALGVAIETVEAWLLADEKALNEALAPDPPVSTLASPERLNGGPHTDKHPKVVFRTIVGRARAGTSTPYDDVAACVRLDILKQRCSDGFAPFADEIQKRCE